MLGVEIMNFYNKSVKEVIKELNSNIKGLNDDEVEIRSKSGKNKLVEAKKRSKILKFFDQFKDIMIIILIIAAIFSFFNAIDNNESFVEPIIIIAIVILNALMGFIQEEKADQAVAALKEMQVSSVRVRRNDNVFIVNSEDIVVGDIILLEAGDKVPADARLIETISLKVDESSLTGESLPVIKNTSDLERKVPLSERNNMIYSGTSVVYGKCEAVVVAIGMNTEFGLIAKSLNQTTEETTPLQKKINEISKYISIIIFVVIFIMLLIGILKGMQINDVVMLAISLAVAAIPEGLPAVITVILSLGISSLARKKAIVRRLSSVETLGCTEVICSDKTGTITENKMTIRETYFNFNLFEGNGMQDKTFLELMTLNNDVVKNGNEYIGDPTEIAIYNYCEKSIDIHVMTLEHKRVAELPFDSERKMMTTINEYGDINRAITKGSFDSLIKCCSHILVDHQIRELTEVDKKKLLKAEHDEADKAYRVLAFAYKDLESEFTLNEEIENDLIFVGMVSMIDPPRSDVKEAIALCKSAHIRPIMITGDSLTTASAIAREIGIIDSPEEAITGQELDNLSKSELRKAVLKYKVFARVSPMNKLAIVNALKQNNKIVAMTGDGVNDAPALKAANIGVGMGITGTEVSKNVSDIILSDDSFSTIVVAVKEGRRIFDNIRNVLVYLLTSNIAEILIVLMGIIFDFEIFLPIQLLYINLITDSIPAIALGFEEADEDVMKREVRKKDSSFFTPFLLSKIIISSIFKTIVVLMVFNLGLVYSLNIARTMAFLSLAVLEIFYAYSCRNIKKPIFNKNILSNKFMNYSVMALLVFQILVFITPIRHIFNLEHLALGQVLIAVGAPIVVLIVDEVFKKITPKIFKD
jgi:P-type Ca2+ transporter type 2C